MYLITDLPHSYGHNAVFTIVDHLLKHITFVPCSKYSTAPDLALLFYDKIVCKFSMPVKVVGDR